VRKISLQNLCLLAQMLYLQIAAGMYIFFNPPPQGNDFEDLGGKMKTWT